MSKNTYCCIGIMTGNSLDAVDAVITEFNNTKITDLAALSTPFPINLADRFRNLKNLLAQNNGNIQKIASDTTLHFKELHDDYINLIAQTVNELISQSGIKQKDIDAIGFHGQTCYHLPPSIASHEHTPSTLQIGSGQMLADITNISVAFDFRSDDLMNGGEAAPLAPIHNKHLALSLKSQGIFPLAFCNGGNTGNISLVYDDKVKGWDTGPFNHLIDFLTRNEKNEPCDFNGKYGKNGKINLKLLKELFEQTVLNEDSQNFILKNPPKSADPAWYKIIPSLTNNSIPFEDRIRTAEFFSAYIFAFSLKFSPIGTPEYFLVFGGGWNNPVIMKDFANLIHGKAPVLPEHQEIFEKIKNPQTKINWSDDYGYSGKYMEARIFADMAKCLITQEPFSYPETTGCHTPTIGGILVHPNEHNPQLWSRAAYGWKNVSNDNE